MFKKILLSKILLGVFCLTISSLMASNNAPKEKNIYIGDEAIIKQKILDVFNNSPYVALTMDEIINRVKFTSTDRQRNIMHVLSLMKKNEELENIVTENDTYFILPNIKKDVISIKKNLNELQKTGGLVLTPFKDIAELNILVFELQKGINCCKCVVDINKCKCTDETSYNPCCTAGASTCCASEVKEGQDESKFLSECIKKNFNISDQNKIDFSTKVYEIIRKSYAPFFPQAKLVQDILEDQSKKQLTIFQGVPGAGKTAPTIIWTLSVLRALGLKAYSTAPNPGGVNALKGDFGEAKAKDFQSNVRTFSEIENTSLVPEGSYVIVDEAFMMKIPELANLLETAVAHKLKLIFSGDSMQNLPNSYPIVGLLSNSDLMLAKTLRSKLDEHRKFVSDFAKVSDLEKNDATRTKMLGDALKNFAEDEIQKKIDEELDIENKSINEKINKETEEKIKQYKEDVNSPNISNEDRDKKNKFLDDYKNWQPLGKPVSENQIRDTEFTTRSGSIYLLGTPEGYENFPFWHNWASIMNKIVGGNFSVFQNKEKISEIRNYYTGMEPIVLKDGEECKYNAEQDPTKRPNMKDFDGIPNIGGKRKFSVSENVLFVTANEYYESFEGKQVRVVDQLNLMYHDVLVKAAKVNKLKDDVKVSFEVFSKDNLPKDIEKTITLGKNTKLILKKGIETAKYYDKSVEKTKTLLSGTTVFIESMNLKADGSIESLKVREKFYDTSTLEIKGDDLLRDKAKPGVYAFDYGYALTSADSQGLGVPFVFVALPKDMDKAELYVALTRHKQNVFVVAKKSDFATLEKLYENKWPDRKIEISDRASKVLDFIK